MDKLRAVKKMLASELNFSDYIGVNIEDLHQEIYNSDYYIIGYYEAEQFLIKNIGVFEAIGIIQEYEQFNFGELYTKLDNSESICNMLAYIAGEQLLSELEVYNYEGILTDKIAKKLQKLADNY